VDLRSTENRLPVKDQRSARILRKLLVRATALPLLVGGGATPTPRAADRRLETRRLSAGRFVPSPNLPIVWRVACAHRSCRAHERWALGYETAWQLPILAGNPPRVRPAPPRTRSVGAMAQHRLAFGAGVITNAPSAMAMCGLLPGANPNTSSHWPLRRKVGMRWLCRWPSTRTSWQV